MWHGQHRMPISFLFSLLNGLRVYFYHFCGRAASPACESCGSQRRSHVCGRTCLVGTQAPVLFLLLTVPEGSLPLGLGGRQAHLGPGLGWVVQSWLSVSLSACAAWFQTWFMSLFSAPGLPWGQGCLRELSKSDPQGGRERGECSVLIPVGAQLWEDSVRFWERLIKVGLLSRVATLIVNPYYFVFLFFPLPSTVLPGITLETTPYTQILISGYAFGGTQTKETVFFSLFFFFSFFYQPLKHYSHTLSSNLDEKLCGN